MERIHIAILGRCNAGKSSLLNLLTGAPTALVSPQAGTTTDPVRKNGEVLGIGPVTFIDTAGWDDGSVLGPQRVAGTREAIRQADIALLVYREWGTPEDEILSELEREGIPIVKVHNEWDDAHGILTGDPDPLFKAITAALPRDEKPSMFGNNVKTGDTVLLVTPIDGAAPKGRLILPQVQAIRELLDKGVITLVVQPEQLTEALEKITPSLIVTDSQVLKEVLAAAPDVETTTFSILLASVKGDRALYEKGLAAVDALNDGDRVLIAESCTHQTSCEDIGQVKIPQWLQEYTGINLSFTVLSGLAPLPDDLKDYVLVIQCGGCMVTRTQLQRRIRAITAAGVPVTNYGMLIQKIRR